MAEQIADDELESVLPEAFSTEAGARRLEADELRGCVPLRRYVANAASCEVHVPGGHPIHGRGVDTRQPADPAWPEQRPQTQLTTQVDETGPLRQSRTTGFK